MKGGQQVVRQRPGLERQVGAVHESVRPHGKVFVACPTAKGLGMAGGPGLDMGGMTGRTADPIGPALFDKPRLGRGVVGKLMEERNQAQLCGHTMRLAGMGNRVYKSPN